MRRVANHRPQKIPATSTQPHLRHPASSIYEALRLTVLYIHPRTNHHLTNRSESSIKHNTHTTNMPVPMPSTTEKSTSTSSTAHEVENQSTQSVASATHTEKTEAEKEAERLYEERIEEEYAKREGGV